MRAETEQDVADDLQTEKQRVGMLIEALISQTEICNEEYAKRTAIVEKLFGLDTFKQLEFPLRVRELVIEPMTDDDGAPFSLSVRPLTELPVDFIL